MIIRSSQIISVFSVGLDVRVLMTSSSSSRPGARDDFGRIWAELPADTVLKLPWEHGYWKDFFNGPSNPRGVRDWKVAEPPLFVQIEPAVEQGTVKKPRRTERRGNRWCGQGLSRLGRTSVKLTFRYLCGGGMTPL